MGELFAPFARPVRRHSGTLIAVCWLAVPDVLQRSAACGGSLPVAYQHGAERGRVRGGRAVCEGAAVLARGEESDACHSTAVSATHASSTAALRPGWTPIPTRTADADADSAAWARIRAALRTELGDHNFDAWLAPLSLVGCDGDRVTLAAPSAFLADWVNSNFADKLRLHWTAQRPGTRQVSITVLPATAVAAPLPATRAAGSRRVASACRSSSAIPLTASSSASRTSSPTTPPMPWPSRARVGFNPLFLHGTTGLGKTHLMHAIGNAFLARQPNAKVAYLSAEKFMVEFLAALRAKDTIAFKQRLRSVDLLMIDDVQFIAGKESTQEEFFHTMNEIISAGKRLVITADRSPAEPRRHPGTHPQPHGLGPGRRHQPGRLRAAPQHPARQAGGDDAEHRRAGRSHRVPGAQDHRERPRARRRAQPRHRLCGAGRQSR